MNVNNDYTQALEAAKLAVENARAKAEVARVAAEKEKTEAEEANKEVEVTKEGLTAQQNIYTEANSKVTEKQTEYDNAVTYLESISASDDESAISQARAKVDKLLEELKKVQDDAKQEYEKLMRAQQDAQTAVKRAEIENKEAQESLKELEEAETELEQAEAELKEAEEAAEAAKVTLANEVAQLTEEEAIAEGYTIIKTPEDLKAMVNNLSGKYILMNDIDLAGIEWEPIGNMDPNAEDPFENAFSGVFNGNGFTIKNLTIKDDGTSNSIGLFGATDGAEIRNIILENINVSAPTDYNETAVGGLIGISRDTNLDNITVTGSVSGHQGVGGLIGITMDSSEFGKVTISNVNANVNVDASFYAGGLIGKVESTEQNSLVIENCHTNGSINITDQSAGGLIGEAGKTVITVNNCSSSMDITKEGEEDTALSWLLDDTSKIGGIIGNCNGTYISICNSKFNGTLNCDDEFKGENYGWYMNDAQVSIFELSAGLPVDDILNIDGVDAITPIIDPNTGVAHYDITVSTLAGMNRIVDMIQANPKLAEIITFNIQFDFETMDSNYDNSSYSQYGVVQHLYEDEDGNVCNDVYIDNEIDFESTFNVGFVDAEPCDEKPCPQKTMVVGLYKDSEGYYVYTPGTSGGKYDDYTKVTLEFFFENQSTIVNKRLNSDEVRLRERMTDKVYDYQKQIQDILKERYGWDPEKPCPIIKEPEYKALKKKQMAGGTLTPEEELKIAIFELNYTIMNIVGDITKNEGCGMGGNASFLEKNNGVVLEDEWGRERWMTDNGVELRQKVDENGELMFDDDGNPVFETLEGEPYDGDSTLVYKVRAFAVTDENGNMLYTDKEGKTVIETKTENETVYTYEDGTPYEGNPEELTQQMQEYSPKDMMDDLTEDMDNLLAFYQDGGAVDPSKENNGLPEKEDKENPEEEIE